jgi:L-cysteine:1D-myo-inositol 2-amino-2-deoxy-alpha-D-glucopyranoside ligase
MDSWRAARVPELPGRAPETQIRDTASGRLVRAASGPVATLYACGITPYDATHVGHAATYLAWDLLVRAWRDAGHQVSYVQNVTDVDDPLLERAARDGVDWRELADQEIERFRGDMVALRLLPPDHYVGAVEALGDIERFNQLLGERGALYELEGDFYFARSADPAFGAVAGLDTVTMLTLAAERGGDPGRPGKKDPLDPLVWLAARPGEPAWASEFGRGRPGWHVECAAIATRYLGVSFDVQAGGTDLAFPHHEMSASHARVAHGGAAGPAGPVFARSYAHAGMVRLDGEKMSKSLGNLVFVSGLLAGGADPMAIRLAILAHHYAADWDWTAESLDSAQVRLATWRRALALATEPGTRQAGPAPPGPAPPGPAPPGQAPPGQAGPGPAPPGPAPLGQIPPGSAPAGAEEPAAGTAAASAADASAAAAMTSVSEPVAAAQDVLAAVRDRLADDLDAPGALAVVDRWAAAVIASDGAASGQASGARLVGDTVDALLGVEL